MRLPRSLRSFAIRPRRTVCFYNGLAIRNAIQFFKIFFLTSGLLLETFAKPKIVILRTVRAVRNISKFGTITGFEILLPPRRDQNDKFRDYAKPSIKYFSYRQFWDYASREGGNFSMRNIKKTDAKLVAPGEEMLLSDKYYFSSIIFLL